MSYRLRCLRRCRGLDAGQGCDHLLVKAAAQSLVYLPQQAAHISLWQVRGWAVGSEVLGRRAGAMRRRRVVVAAAAARLQVDDNPPAPLQQVPARGDVLGQRVHG